MANHGSQGRDRLRLASLMPFGQKKEVMEKIVLEEELSERLNWTTNSLVNAKKNGTPFRLGVWGVLC